MGLKKLVKQVCEKLGEANLPVYTVAAVAVFKGILRPTFTMIDKKQDPETKKYAAIREGATELIAIPTYIGMSYLTQKLAPAFSPNGKSLDTMLHSAKSTLGFFGVCFAALYAIPKLCNVAMPHVMKALKMEKVKKEPEHQLDISENSTANPVNPNVSVKNIQPSYAKTPINVNGGMRV